MILFTAFEHICLTVAPTQAKTVVKYFRHIKNDKGKYFCCIAWMAIYTGIVLK